MAAAKENPGPAGAGAGPSSYEKLHANNSASELIREAQAAVARLLETVDRLAASIAKVAQ